MRGDHPVQGTKRKQPVSLRLGFASEQFGYAIDLGLPTPSSSAFALDPEIKRECVWNGEILRPASLLVDRRGPLVRTRTRGCNLISLDKKFGETRIADGGDADEAYWTWPAR